MTAAAIGKWDEARRAIWAARCWYQTNGDYCLAQFAIENRREDWLRLIRVIDVKMYETEDHSAHGLFSMPEEFIPQAAQFIEDANSAQITLFDGRTVHFELPPTSTPPTTP